MTTSELIRKIEIHIETTEECIDNCNIGEETILLLEQDIELYKLVVNHLKSI